VPEWLPNLVAVLLWMAFWFFAVDWRKVGPFLREGAWAPCVLLGLMAALAWSRIAPSDEYVLGGLRLANFWWQLGVVGLLMALALFCGWLQEQWRYEPPEIQIEPPPAEHGHGHGHDLAHH